MVTDRTRTDVWLGLWDARRMVRYYQAMHRRHLAWHRASLWLLAAFGAGVFATPALGLAAAAAALWILFAECAAKSAVSLSIAGQCEEIADEWATLFARIDDPGEAMGERRARESLDGIKRRMKAATHRSGDANIRDNERINERATAAATRELEAAYAP